MCPSLPEQEMETQVDPAVEGTAPTERGATPMLGQRYELLSLLGSGGMGTVYRAHDRILEEIVALKVVRRDVARSATVLERFRREVKLARKVTHKNVARMFDIGNDRGEHYLTMEYVEGDSLSSAFSEPLTAADVIAIALQVCDGLTASHEAGVVHGDLKPANVLYTGAGRIVITDFGIARALTPAPGDPFTEDGVVAGTPGYMSPEQVSGAADLDGRTDVYALGCMLYRLLTGAPPWTGVTTVAIAAARLLNPPPDPRERVKMPDTLAEVVLRCMARDRNARYASAREVAAGLGGPAAERSWAPVPSRSVARSSRSVAVLPFENLGARADDYLSDGFAGELVDLLCSHSDLRVMPCRSLDREPRATGRALGVGVVVHGTIARRGDMLDVVVRVLAVDDGFQLHARRALRPSSEIMMLAREVATSVAATLSSHEGAGGTLRSAETNPEAIDLYLRGRAIYTRSYFDADRSAALLAEAYALAPEDGRIGAAYALAMMRHFHVKGLDVSYLERARDVAIEALVNHRHSATAHTALAMIHLEQGELRSGGAELRRALDIDPMQIDALASKGRLLLEAGRTELAIEILHGVRMIDPSFEVADVLLARAYADLGDFEAANDVLARPNPAASDATLRWGLRVRLLAWARDPAGVTSALAELEADTRLSDEAKMLPRRILRAMVERAIDAGELAAITSGMPRAASPRASMFRVQATIEMLAALGQDQRALELIPQLDQHELCDLAWLDRCPLLDRLRETPELQAVRRNVVPRVARALEALLDNTTATM